MTPNTTPEKPEWFELVDGDAPSAQVRKVNKKLPAIAVLVSGAVIATGAFFASASENEEFEGGDDQIIAADISTGTGSSDVVSDNSAPAIGGTSTVAGITPANPNTASGGVGVPKPGGLGGAGQTGGGHEFGEHEEREHHERGEHHDGDRDRDHDDDHESDDDD